jgi:exonuclease III
MPTLCLVIFVSVLRFSLIMDGSLKVFSLNCHGFDSSTALYLQRVGKDLDVILLQETWLSDINCYKISEAMPAFDVFHSSAMELKIVSGLFTGRPFGGTAVLLHKRFSKCSHQIFVNNPRITAICYEVINGGSVIVASVYMPYNAGTAEYVAEYESVMGDLQGIMDRNLGCKFIFGGDWNISKNVVGDSFLAVNRFCGANHLVWLDHDTSSVSYTYHNDKVGCHTLIDHFVCSPDLVDVTQNVHICIDGDNMSDHLAISNRVSMASWSHMPKNSNNVSKSVNSSVRLLWEKVDIVRYQSVLCSRLADISLPIDALCCVDSNCDSHQAYLEQYYCDIIGCLATAGLICVPSVKVGIQKHWWTPELDDLKQQCIDATALWKSVGCPRNGDINTERLRCKYKYKIAIKDAINDGDRSFNDSLFERLSQKDNSSFWKSWRKHFCSKNLKATNMLNGKTGDDEILYEFTNYYKKVTQSNTAEADLKYRDDVNGLLNASSSQSIVQIPHITSTTVEKCIDKLKHSKAAGIDGIHNEHVVFGGTRLSIHLCMLFNAMLRHAFVPNDFCKGIILPLLKNKHGDATQLDMYRGITLAPALSKLFESVLLDTFEEYFVSDQLQFGFKRNSSCCHAIYAVSESIKYFNKHGSKVHCALLDASKAFDKVLHNGLFKKMITRGVPLVLVRILKHWYSHLCCAVRWNSTLGEFFSVECGIRQGGVLSPFLFAFYIDDLIDNLRQSGYGIHIGGLFVGCVVYADDIVVLSASCYGLQRLIDVCSLYGVAWDIKFNPSKSQLISFGGRCSDCIIYLNGSIVKWGTKAKYLGVQFLCNSGLVDVSDSLRKFYGQFNNIMSVLGKHRNEMVAVHLVKTYCLPSLIYGCEGWMLNTSSLQRINVAWNNCFRRIFSCCYRESVKPLQFFCECLPISYLIDQRKLLFLNKMHCSDNTVLRTLCYLSRYNSSSIGSVYNITRPITHMSVRDVKDAIWSAFVANVGL